MIPAPLLLIMLAMFMFVAIFAILTRKLAGYLVGIALCFVILAGIVWFGMSVVLPIQIQSITHHPIRTVIYPDGTKQQMFTVNGVHYNANVRWSQIIDENEYEVECIVPVTNYFGIDYCNSASVSVQFNLLKKREK